MFLIMLLVSSALWHIINALTVNNDFFLILVSALYPLYLVVKCEYDLNTDEVARRREKPVKRVSWHLNFISSLRIKYLAWKGGGGKARTWTLFLEILSRSRTLYFCFLISTERTSVHLALSYLSSAYRIQQQGGYASGRQHGLSLGNALNSWSFLNLLIHIE